MTALAVLAAAEGTFTEELHPRGTGDQGGQFVAGSGGKGGSGKSARARKAASTMSWDPKSGRGSGYGKRGGDRRVRRLQAALNNLGIHDAQGKPLALDGDYGPKTSSAVRALQQKLGLPADGKVTPQLLAKVLAMPGAKTKAKPRPKGKPVREAFAGASSPAVRLMVFARTLESSWNSALHPRLGRGESGGGRFTSGTAVAHALSSGAADALDGFNREQLRREAKRRGLTLRRGASINEIRDLLHDHHADNGGKAHAESPPVVAKPKQAQSAAAAAVSPAGHGEDGVRAAYTALADIPGETVSLAELRQHMGGSRAEQDRSLTDMARRGDIVLFPEENQKRISPTDRAAALRIGGEDRHLIMIEKAPQRSAADPFSSTAMDPLASTTQTTDIGHGTVGPQQVKAGMRLKLRGHTVEVLEKPRRAARDSEGRSGWVFRVRREDGVGDGTMRINDGDTATVAPPAISTPKRTTKSTGRGRR